MGNRTMDDAWPQWEMVAGSHGLHAGHGTGCQTAELSCGMHAAAVEQARPKQTRRPAGCAATLSCALPVMSKRFAGQVARDPECPRAPHSSPNMFCVDSVAKPWSKLPESAGQLTVAVNGP